MDWSSFVFGLVFGGLGIGVISGLLGIGIGCSMMVGFTEMESDLTRIIRHAGKEVPVGDTISFTIGHDVMFPCGDDDDLGDDGDDEEDSPLSPINGWGRA